ncbi:MAG: methylglyoxal synthase [Neomegalonema sp.]|nr:methylglyoxal synthase [Neomegalonema sp.]
MSFHFIFMLTENDRTIPDAEAKLAEVLAGGARHIGFKDVGLPLADLKRLAAQIRAAGACSYLEVVSLDEQSELASARAAITLDVDCLLGGTRAEAVVPLIRDHPIRYYPFPGTITGHPSVLEGSIESIAASAERLAALEGVHGLDLLAYRFAGDVPALMRAVCSATRKPVIIAGSIDRAERIEAAARAGAAGFTVGTAAFRAEFPAQETGLEAQVRAILAQTRQAGGLSTVRRRIALVAHDARKPHLIAWVSQHLDRLQSQRLICTGGTGALLRERFAQLEVQRLQRGIRGGDQQLGAMIATGALDAVIFFADPTSAQGMEADLLALTRLAILHDTPLALSPTAADLVVQGIGVQGVGEQGIGVAPAGPDAQS